MFKLETKIIEEYDLLKPLLEKWSEKVTTHISTLIDNSELDIKQIFIQNRIKASESLIKHILYKDSKIRREMNSRKISDAIRDVKDKIGSRYIVKDSITVECLKEIIKSDNEIWEANISRERKKWTKNPKEFDYNALHISVYPKESEGEFGDSKKKRLNLRCEIQIKTFLEHGYSEVAHDALYKGIFIFNDEMIRLSSKTLALLEIADENFEKLKSRMTNPEIHKKTILKYITEYASDRLEIDLNSSIDYDLNESLSYDFKIEKNFDKERADFEKILFHNKILLKKLYEKSKIKDSVIIKQPLFLFVIYKALRLENDFLLEKWDYSSELLDELYFYLSLDKPY